MFLASSTSRLSTFILDWVGASAVTIAILPELRYVPLYASCSSHIPRSLLFVGSPLEAILQHPQGCEQRVGSLIERLHIQHYESRGMGEQHTHGQQGVQRQDEAAYFWCSHQYVMRGDKPQLKPLSEAQLARIGVIHAKRTLLRQEMEKGAYRRSTGARE